MGSNDHKVFMHLTPSLFNEVPVSIGTNGRVMYDCARNGNFTSFYIFLIRIQYSYLHSNVIMCIDVYCRIIDKMT
jgi:hypothetical protein